MHHGHTSRPGRKAAAISLTLALVVAFAPPALVGSASTEPSAEEPGPPEPIPTTTTLPPTTTTLAPTTTTLPPTTTTLAPTTTTLPPTTTTLAPTTTTVPSTTTTRPPTTTTSFALPTTSTTVPTVVVPPIEPSTTTTTTTTTTATTSPDPPSRTPVEQPPPPPPPETTTTAAPSVSTPITLPFTDVPDPGRADGDLDLGDDRADPELAATDTVAGAFTIDPGAGPPGSIVEMLVELDGVISGLTSVEVFLDGDPWGDPVAITGSRTSITRTVPRLEPGAYEIELRSGDGVLASTSFAVTDTLAAGAESSSDGVPWVAIAALIVVWAILGVRLVLYLRDPRRVSGIARRWSATSLRRRWDPRIRRRIDEA